jgi:hypothetical protein
MPANPFIHSTILAHQEARNEQRKWSHSREQNLLQSLLQSLIQPFIHLSYIDWMSLLCQRAQRPNTKTQSITMWLCPHHFTEYDPMSSNLLDTKCSGHLSYVFNILAYWPLFLKHSLPWASTSPHTFLILSTLLLSLRSLYHPICLSSNAMFLRTLVFLFGTLTKFLLSSLSSYSP